MELLTNPSKRGKKLLRNPFLFSLTFEGLWSLYLKPTVALGTWRKHSSMFLRVSHEGVLWKRPFEPFSISVYSDFSKSWIPSEFSVVTDSVHNFLQIYSWWSQMEKDNSTTTQNPAWSWDHFGFRKPWPPPLFVQTSACRRGNEKSEPLDFKTRILSHKKDNGPSR